MSVVAKRAKSKRKPDSAAETLDQLESLGDRLGNWIVENAVWIAGAAALVLVSAGAYGFVNSRQSDVRQEASAALAKTEGSYLRAMGGSADSLQIEEPANPETGRRVQEAYAKRYSEVADEFPGTVEAAIAALESGVLQFSLGRSEEATGTWQAALDATSDHGAIRGLLFQRMAGAQEAQGRWTEAAAAHEAASEIEDYPIRYLAMAEAARCYLEAGDAGKALEVFDRLESEGASQQIAPHIRARLDEVRASQ